MSLPGSIDPAAPTRGGTRWPAPGEDPDRTAIGVFLFGRRSGASDCRPRALLRRRPDWSWPRRRLRCRHNSQPTTTPTKNHHQPVHPIEMLSAATTQCLPKKTAHCNSCDQSRSRERQNNQCTQAQFCSKLDRMEYRQVRYTLRAGIERGQWSVAIYPQGIEMAEKKVFGTHEDAEFEAHLMIDRWWLKARRRLDQN
jgi:hypothetical protein